MRTPGGMGSSHLVLDLLVLGLLGCPVLPDTVDPDGKLTLTLLRPPTADEMVAVRLTVGALARNARIVVRTADGEIAGTVAPFGMKPGQKAGVFTIPIPGKALTNNQVSLKLEVLEKDAKAARAATRTEIEDAKLVLIPASRRVEKGSK
jgi:hypothetical protein